MTITANQLENELAQFTGTIHYYRHLSGMLYTDGVKFFAERAGAYWLIDLIGSYIYKFKSGFYIVEATSANNKGLITFREDTDEPILQSQQIEYTDLVEGIWKFYLIDNVLIIPSEY